MNIDKTKIIKMIVILLLLVIGVRMISQVVQKNSLTLTEYAALYGKTQNTETETSNTNEASQDITSTETETLPDTTYESELFITETNVTTPSSKPEQTSSQKDFNNTQETETETETPQPSQTPLENPSTLTGFLLNGNTQEENRIIYQEFFYYEPLSENLQRYITGVSYPQIKENEEPPTISLEELRYVHILHYNFDGIPIEGELICNQAIAQDLVEIFYELYQNEYQLEKVLLIDEYNGDDNASMEDNNTSCFNYRVVEGSTHLSKHAFGLAIDINPLYNPYITYTDNGGENILPASASAYADRTASFPYKIDENDLCYKLFKEHGFTWGGNWNSCKDYQHFQKTIP